MEHILCPWENQQEIKKFNKDKKKKFKQNVNKFTANTEEELRAGTLGANPPPERKKMVVQLGEAQEAAAASS